jgi:hypothetical protein
MESPLSKWKVKSGQSTLHTKHNLRKTPLPRPPNHKEKKGRHLHSMTRLLIGFMEILFIKLAATILTQTNSTSEEHPTYSALGLN